MSVKASSQVSMLDITDAYSVTLTSEAFAFVGNTSGAPSGSSCATQVIAYCGTQRCSKVTIGTVSCPSGISASISNNGTNAPTITFTTTATITAACEATIPVMVDGVTINKKFSFAVAKRGDTGNGVSSSTVDYQVSSSGTTIPTGTWQPSVPSVSPGQYLWTRTILKYTNGSSSSASYSVGRMGTNGTDGTNGSDGRGIKSTVVTYQAGSSGTSAPTGIWTSSVPATSASAPYLWSKTVITYTDNTPSTTYSVGSTPEGIVVGGRNLIQKSAIMPGVFSTNSSGASAMGTAAYQSDGSALVTNSNSNFRFMGPEFNVAAGEVYTISAYYKEVSGTQTYQFQITYTAGISGTTSGVGTKQNIGDGWIKSHYTFTIPSGVTQIRIWLRSGEDFKAYTHSYYIKHPKLELGNKATDWTPAPEDVDAAINSKITSVDVEYYLSTSATSLSGGSWQTTAPTWIDGKYMWSRTKTVKGDGTISYKPSETGTCIAGAKGSIGSTGKGVSSITEEYYLSTSKTSQIGGSWTTTPPVWSSGKYVWTRSKIVYTNPSSTAYTTPICDSSWEVVNEMQVGGRNLIQKSAIMPGVFSTDSSGAYPMGTAAYQSDGSALVTNSNSNFRFMGPEFNVAAGEVYTISAYYKEVSGTQTYQFQITYTAGISGGTSGVGTKQNIGDGWIKSYHTFIIPTGCTKIRIWLRSGEDYKLYTHSYYIKHPKLELGNKATDWTPAPEDTEAEISALATRVTNAETSITKTNEAIELRATKTEVAQTYATKTDVNNIQVGGRNLLLKTDVDQYGYGNWVSNGSTMAFNNNGSETGGIPLQTKNINLSGSFGGMTYNGWIQLKGNTCYAYSIYVYISSGTSITFYDSTPLHAWCTTDRSVGNAGIANWNVSCSHTLGSTLPTGQWIRLWSVIKTANGASTYWFKPFIYGIGTGNTYWCHPKLEEGNRVTDWTPAPEDLETRVTTAESSINQAAKKISMVVKSGDSESNMVLTDKMYELVANDINLKGRITISGLNSDTQTKINNGNSAKSTVDANSSKWTSAYNWTNGNGGNMTNLLSMVKKWTNNAVSDTTTIQGGWIATNTITANKLAIGDFTNYCTVNPNVPETMLPTSSVHGGTKVAGTSDTGGSSFVKASNSQQFLMFCDFTPFLFKPGEQLYFYGNIPNYSSSDCSAVVNMWLYDSNKRYIGINKFWGGTLTKNTWNKISGSITITNSQMTNVKYFLIGIDTGTTDHNIGAADLICKKKAGGELIVDGAITAAKISAGAITADKIAAGAITAAKINVSSLSAISANMGSITAGSMNIGNGKFVVDSSGNLTASSATITGTITGSSGYFTNGFDVTLYDTDSSGIKWHKVIRASEEDFVAMQRGFQYQSSLGYSNINTIAATKTGITLHAAVRDSNKNWIHNPSNTDYGSIYIAASNKINIVTEPPDDSFDTIRIYIGGGGNVKVDHHLWVGSYLRVGAYKNPNYFLSTDSFICNSWVRTVGSTGWYNETFGGGWYMIDSSWIRTYGSKNIYQNAGIMRTDGTLQVGESGRYFNANSSGITLSGPTTINATATTCALIPAANATYALGEGGSKGWSNIYIGNASNTYNGLRIINGTTNYNLCGINSSNTMIFGDPSWTPYIYVKNTSTPTSGAVQSFTIGDNGSTNINDAHVWLYGRNDTTSRYIGSYLVYARTYGSAANVVVTSNGVLGRSTSSSKRYKHDIREFSVDEVSCLYDLPLKKFKYNNDYISKDDEYYNKDLYGFIVEDLDEVLPISVQHNLDDDAEYTIPEMWNNNIIVPCLLKLIQDLNNRLKKVEEGKEN